MRKLIFIVCLCILSHSSFGQYSFTATATATATVSSTYALSFSSLVGTSSLTTLNDYLNGQTTANYARFEIKSNVPWVLEFTSNAALFTATGGGASTNMPCSIVSIRVNGTSTFKALTTTTQALTTGNRGPVSTSGNTFNIDVNYNPGLNYNGGTYSLNVLYTLTSQ